MSAFKMSGMVAALALAGLLPVPPVATALDAQEYANIQSQCRRESQDYGVAPEQIEEYVNSCVQSYGGMPEAAPEAEVPAVDEQDTEDAGEQDSGSMVE